MEDTWPFLWSSFNMAVVLTSAGKADKSRKNRHLRRLCWVVSIGARHHQKCQLIEALAILALDPKRY